MVRYEIRGLIREDGKATTISIDAASEDEAVRRAGDMGIVVERVTARFVDRLPSPTPTPGPTIPTSALDEDAGALTGGETFVRHAFLFLAVLSWLAVIVGCIATIDPSSDALSVLTQTIGLNAAILTALGCTLCAQMILLRGTIRRACKGGSTAPAPPP